MSVIAVLTLGVNLGGASRQAEGGEDQSRPGKNQRGAGQEGRTHVVTHSDSHTLTTVS